MPSNTTQSCGSLGQQIDFPVGAEVVDVHGSPGPIGPMNWDIRITYLSGKQETVNGVRNGWKYEDDVDYNGDGPGSPVGICMIGRHRKFMFKCEPIRRDCEENP